MSYYDAIGQCATGCGPAVAPYSAYPGYGYGYAPLAVFGQAPTPPPTPAEPGTWQKIKDFGQKESLLGIKNQNLALGAVALGTIYYGYTRGWFGRRRR
jgi:hypothetical protein